jgi:hypothetical protein
MEWSFWINDKRETIKKFLATSKTEDKIDYSHKRAISKTEIHKTHWNRWETFVSSLQRDIYQDHQPQAYKVLKKVK